MVQKAEALPAVYEAEATQAIRAEGETVIQTQRSRGALHDGFDSVSFTGKGGDIKVFINDAKNYQREIGVKDFNSFGLSGKVGTFNQKTLDTSLRLAEQAILREVPTGLTQTALILALKEQTATIRIIAPHSATLTDATRNTVKRLIDFNVAAIKRM